MNTKMKKTEKKVWVELEINKYSDGITVFRGMIDKTDLDAWHRGELIDCSIKLEKTYFLIDGSVFMLGQGDSNACQYTGDTYFRVDTIMILYVLKEDSFPTKANDKTDNIFPFPGRKKQ
jgi:hypothetical protein